jgi:hypothetical protein
MQQSIPEPQQVAPIHQAAISAQPRHSASDLQRLKEELGMTQTPFQKAWKPVSGLLQDIGNIVGRRPVHPARDYETEEANKNLALLEYLKREREHQERMSHQLNQLEESRRYHDMMAPQYAAHAEELRERVHEKQLYKQKEKEFEDEYGFRAKYIPSYTPSMQLHTAKKHEGYIEKADAALKAREEATILMRAAETHPHLFNSAYFSILSKYGNDPTLLNNVLSKSVPEKDRDMLFAINAASKGLYINSVKGLPARGLNMQIEKVIRGATGGGHMSTGAVLELMPKVIEEADSYYNEYSKANELFNQGYDVTVGPRKKLSASRREAEPAAIPEAHTPHTGVQYLKSQIPELGKFRDDEIEKVLMKMRGE